MILWLIVSPLFTLLIYLLTLGIIIYLGLYVYRKITEPSPMDAVKETIIGKMGDDLVYDRIEIDVNDPDMDKKLEDFFSKQFKQ